MRENNWGIRFVFVLVLLTGFLFSCGKKTMIRAPIKVRPPAVNDLKCFVKTRLVELQWHIPPWKKNVSGGKVAKFQIWRALEKKSEKNCPGCPKEFTPVTIVDLQYPFPAHVKGNIVMWRDLNITIGNRYQYRVVTIDTAGNESLISNTVIANVSNTPAPVEITRVVATPKGINLEWKDPKIRTNGKSDLRTHFYLIFRRKLGSTWEQLNNRPLDKLLFTDDRVMPDEVYEYMVRVQVDQEGTPTLSDLSETVQVKALELPPPAPPDTVWALPSSKGIEIHWMQSEEGKKLLGYNVYRKKSDGSIEKINESPLKTMSFLDTNIEEGKIYNYAVTAVRGGEKTVEGPYSKWVEIRFVRF